MNNITLGHPSMLTRPTVDTTDIVQYEVKSRPADPCIRRWLQVMYKSTSRSVVGKQHKLTTASGQISKQDKLASLAVGRKARVQVDQQLQEKLQVADGVQLAMAEEAAAAQGLGLEDYRLAVAEEPLAQRTKPTGQGKQRTKYLFAN